jgi:hypothetical protein
MLFGDLESTCFALSDHVLARLRFAVFSFFCNLPWKFAVSSKRMTVSAADHEGTKENDRM